MKTSKILAAVATAAVAASCVAVSASAYTGYMCFQTAPYSFRNAWDDAQYGLASDYYDKVIVWGSGDAPEETFPEYADNFDYDINAYTFDGGFNDVTIDGDGTYKVSSDNFVWSVDGASSFNLIFVSTDIPNDGTAAITSATLYVDGVETATTTDIVPGENDKYLSAFLCNIWNPDVGSYDGAYPTKDIAIEFTVEGLGSAATDTGADADTGADKGSPDTGVAGVAAVAGAAIVAGGVLMLAKKRQ